MSINKRILDLPGGQGRRIPSLWLVSAAVMLILVVLILLHTRSRGNVSPIEILLGTPQAPAQDVAVFSQDGVTVYMPPGATELDGTLSMAVTAPGLILVADDTEWDLLKAVRIEFRNPNGMTLSNISFALPLDICFDLTEEQWQAYTAAPESYRVQHYTDQTSTPGWQVLPQVTHADERQLCGQATQLSMFGLAVQTPTAIPVTGGIAPALASDEQPAGTGAPLQAREREEEESVSIPAPEVVPTDPPASEAPPAQPTDPPPAEPAVGPPPENGGPGNGNGNQGNEGPGNGNGHGNQGNEGPGNGRGDQENEGSGNGNGNEGRGNGGRGRGP